MISLDKAIDVSFYFMFFTKVKQWTIKDDDVNSQFITRKFKEYE